MIDKRIGASAYQWVSLFGALVCLSLWQMPAAAQAQSVLSEGDAPVSSDGTRASGSRAEASATVSGSYRGAGRELAFGETDDALANFRSRVETAEEIWALWNARPKTAPVGIESIIGADQRIRVNPTTGYPARATALITFSQGASSFICTGWLIGKDTVATAGHCVADGGSGSFNDRTTYRIYPGRNGPGSPYGSCTAKRLYTNITWLNSGKDDYDYAAIKLNCNIGNTVGWYGFFWQAASLLDLPVRTQGYPGDKPLTQWKAADRVRVDQIRRVFYQADTFGGQSGSPVWTNRSSNCNPCGMAVHAYGIYGSPPFSTNNHGTRITQAVFNNLVRWKNAP